MWNRKLLVEFIKLSPRIPGHKDNLYQKVLVARLPLDYFRFDFRYPSLCWLLSSPTFNMHSTLEVRVNPVGRRGMLD